MKSFFACLILVVVLVTTVAEASQYSLRGTGAYSCGTWTARRTDQRAGTAEQWVLGFLSGIGYVGEDQADPLNGVDGEGVWAWIDNYCRANPIKNIADAAAAFYGEHPR